jgi:hypothetical protein
MSAWKQGANMEGEVIRDFYVEHEPVDLRCPIEEGLTRQEFADECDINVLMATYERGGALNHFNRLTPEFLDVTEVPDLATALSYFDDAQRAFMSLSATVRREFDNDAVKFVDFAQDPSNLEKMREWGLAPPAAVPAQASQTSAEAFSGPAESPATPKT